MATEATDMLAACYQPQYSVSPTDGRWSCSWQGVHSAVWSTVVSREAHHDCKVQQGQVGDDDAHAR